MFNSNKIKGVLFDMDGTVLDSEDLFIKSQLLLLNEYNIYSDSNDLEEFKGMSHKDFYPKLISKFNINENLNVLRSKLRTYLHKIMETDLKFIEGFEDFFNSQIKDSNLKVGIVTNTTRLSYIKIQKCIHIDNYFSFVITVDEALVPKPSPVPFKKAMEKLSLSANETIVIEDSKTGLLSAVKSEAKVIGITTSLSESQIKDINSDITVANSYDDITNIFKKLNY
ncbi:MAG: hypothetical protein CMF96_07820 [Candidatus Marinimicrobia bacterium]|nr:hypothetical protein [Candidatus Neomarinimicrobiota bacterium]